ncbi:MAG: hypothetical protein JKY27_00775 [Magnetovibrio sp.]|nr:hypothetical protein [Magnetovibrio sp.]
MSDPSWSSQMRAQSTHTDSVNALYAFNIFFFIIMTLMMLSSAANAEESLLGGRAFTLPGTTIPMGDDWETQGIRHNTPQRVDLAVALDQQLYPALGPMIEKFAKARGVKIAVQDGTCGISSGLLSEKAVDIGGFCCPPGITDRLPGLKFHTIGIGALALITHKSNSINNIKVEDARKLFGNDIRDWSELPMSGFKSGEHEPVRAIARLHCKIRPGHWRLILDTEQQFGWDLTEVSAIKDMVKQVSLTPGAIGYETLWHLNRLAKSDGSYVKMLSVNNAMPDDATALARSAYPLYRVFNITTWAKGPAYNALSDELVDYLIAHAEDIKPEFAIIPARTLRKYGWNFNGNELIAGPR